MSQYESEFEKELITRLQNGDIGTYQPGTQPDFNKVLRSRLWEYRPDIKTTAQLEQNFKEVLERNNQDLLDRPLTENEFKQVMKQISDLKTPYQAGKFLYGLNGKSEVQVQLEEGKTVYLRVFDQSQIGAGDTVYQIVNQIERPAVVHGNPDRRFDVTLLINGLPIYQIELKKDDVDADEALNQIEQYNRERQFSGIFSTLQVYIGMTPYNAKYMAAVKAEDFNKDFAFKWKYEDNTNVKDWKYIADHYLTIPAAHLLATNYMILDGTKNKEAIKVMRPYQVTATRKALEKIRTTDFDMGTKKDGFIWHTTGSGKTITSFKTASLASRLPNVDKVVFLVDRKSLTRQTLESYQGYDPDHSDESGNELGLITDTKNTSELERKLRSKKNDIIITSTQKMRKLVSRESFKAPNKNILFVVDEAHRSTGTENFDKIQHAFPRSAWIGYSGTPVFDESKKGSRTVDVFGELLHAYTIRDAIADGNVLGFKVDFNTTVPDEVKLQQLRAYYGEMYPNWTEEQIEDKVKNLLPEDMDDSVRGSFYDNNPKHIEAVVKDIIENWQNRSVDWKYNALLTTHVGGNKASIPMALKYYEEFQKQNELRRKHGLREIKVAISVSADESNGNEMNEINEGLRKAISDYNKMFGKSYGLATVDEYNTDLESRLNKTAKDGNFLDLVIVVDRLLTGFDAPELNTLYVDRTLKGANLIQAYSRTNRVFDSHDKPFGNVVNYRWPEYSEMLMNDALAVYSDKNNADLTPEQKKLKNRGDGITAVDFKSQIEETKKVIRKIQDLTGELERIPSSPQKQEELLRLLREYNSQLAKLKQYPVTKGGKEGFDYKKPEELLKKLGISEEQNITITVTLTNELKNAISKRTHVPPHLIDLRVEHLKDVLIDYDFLTELLEDLMNHVHDNEFEQAYETRRKIADFTDSIEDRKYARQVNEASEAILSKQYPTPDSGLKYPYRLTSTSQLMENIENASIAFIDHQMENFRKKWGLMGIIDNGALRKFVSHHQYGEDDLDPNFLKEITKRAGNYYRGEAEDPEIRKMSPMKFSRKLNAALRELADQQIAE